VRLKCTSSTILFPNPGFKTEQDRMLVAFSNAAKRTKFSKSVEIRKIKLFFGHLLAPFLVYIPTI
jgi:hypothetical protein